jgi:acetyl-CoA synthetase
VEGVEARVSRGLIELNPHTFPIMQEVYGKPEKYRERFADGWYRTGDEGRVDSNGYFWFLGRSDDLINTAGEKVSPFEVESALVTHPAVVEAAVVGVADSQRGQVIKAYVVLGEAYSGSEELKKELRDLVRAEVAGFAYPREIEFVTELPKTESGKILRRKLRDVVDNHI